MLLEHSLCIQICSWSIFDLEYYSRLFMLLEHAPGAAVLYLLVTSTLVIMDILCGISSLKGVLHLLPKISMFCTLSQKSQYLEK